AGGGLPIDVASAATASSALEERSEYHVIPSGSASDSNARVASSSPTRHKAAPSAARMPVIASAVGCAPIIKARPKNAASAATAPRQLILSTPVAAPATRV